MCPGLGSWSLSSEVGASSLVDVGYQVGSVAKLWCAVGKLWNVLGKLWSACARNIITKTVGAIQLLMCSLTVSLAAVRRSRLRSPSALTAAGPLLACVELPALNGT